MTLPAPLALLQQKTWQATLPLEIRLSPDDCRTYNDSHVYMIQYPRLSYLPFLLQRCHDFFHPSLISPSIPPHSGWFSFEGVPLKWQHPVGLLFDLFSGAEPAQSDEPSSYTPSPNTRRKFPDSLPWRLTLHFGNLPTDQLIHLDAEGRVHHDSYVNSVKEADFLRNGTGKIMMGLSKDDSLKLWRAVETHNLPHYNAIYNKFIYPFDGAAVRHVPIKVYLPTTYSIPQTTPEESVEQSRSSIKVVQTLVPPVVAGKTLQTLGTALHGMLPTLFPSRRSYIHAVAVLNGIVVPLGAPVYELMRTVAYADGFLHVAVVMVV